VLKNNHQNNPYFQCTCPNALHSNYIIYFSPHPSDLIHLTLEQYVRKQYNLNC